MFPIFSKVSYEINWRGLTKYKFTLIEKVFQHLRRGKAHTKPWRFSWVLRDTLWKWCINRWTKVGVSLISLKDISNNIYSENTKCACQSLILLFLANCERKTVIFTFFHYNMRTLIIFPEISIIHKNNRAKKTGKSTRE